VYNKSTPIEQRWLARIILKGRAKADHSRTRTDCVADMHINVKENTIFSIFHPDAHDLFNTCSDLKKVAYELWDPSRRLKEEVSLVDMYIYHAEHHT
jgi:DNA ligase-4